VWDQLVAVVLVCWVFGWAGGKQLVGQSYVDAKAKAAEMKAEREGKKAEKKAARVSVSQPPNSRSAHSPGRT
jgi:hypothetical protein